MAKQAGSAAGCRRLHSPSLGGCGLQLSEDIVVWFEGHGMGCLDLPGALQEAANARDWLSAGDGRVLCMEASLRRLCTWSFVHWFIGLDLDAYPNNCFDE